MQRFHKWCYNAVQGLAVFCLWWECGNLSRIYIGSPYFGAIVGLFFIGWALGYKEEPQEELHFKEIMDASAEFFKKEQENKKD